MDEYKTIKQLARELRKNQTEAEEMLWQKLRNRKPEGYKFLSAPLSIYKEGLGVSSNNF